MTVSQKTFIEVRTQYESMVKELGHWHADQHADRPITYSVTVHTFKGLKRSNESESLWKMEKRVRFVTIK